MKTAVTLPDGTIVEEPDLETDGICVSYDIKGKPEKFAPGATLVTAHIETNPALVPGEYTITTNAVPE